MYFIVSYLTQILKTSVRILSFKAFIDCRPSPLQNAKLKVACFCFFLKFNLFPASVTEHLLLTEDTISDPSISSLSCS